VYDVSQILNHVDALCSAKLDRPVIVLHAGPRSNSYCTPVECDVLIDISRQFDAGFNHMNSFTYWTISKRRFGVIGLYS